MTYLRPSRISEWNDTRCIADQPANTLPVFLLRL